MSGGAMSSRLWGMMRRIGAGGVPAPVVAVLLAVFLAVWSGPGAAQQMTADGVYVVDNGQAVGPLTHADVEQRIRDGRLTAQTMVWKQGMADWSPARTVKEVAQLLNGLQPPPPPPVRDYNAFLDGRWETGRTDLPIEGIGLGTQKMEVIYNRVGTYTSTQIIEVSDGMGGVLRTTNKGRGTFKITNPSPEGFHLSMIGTTLMTSNGPGGNVPLPGNFNYDSTLRVVDENTLNDNGLIFRRVNY